MKGAAQAQPAAQAVTPIVRPFSVRKIRREFPILRTIVHGKPLIYLDNAATTHKPRPVILAVNQFYTEYNSNIHRGLHALSERATKAFEDARYKVHRFINSTESAEIVFTRGTTEGINLVAQTYGRANVRAGDEVVITTMEHHSNIVPWQILCEEKGARLRVVPISDAGEILLDEYERMLGPRTRLVAVVHLSNALGTINPIRRIIESAHRHGAAVLVDGAQAAAHLPIDVRELDCDFYALSGHKMYAPSGVGVLYGKRRLLETMPPYQSGGDMISSVTFEKTTYNRLPYKFEAGTPNIAGVIGLGAAVDWLTSLDRQAVTVHENDLTRYAMQTIGEIPGVRLIGTASAKSSVVAFVIEGIHPHDIGSILDREGIAVRAGHHCTQPLMARYGVPATTRVSPALYNTREEIDAVALALRKVIEIFR